MDESEWIFFSIVVYCKLMLDLEQKRNTIFESFFIKMRRFKI
jgi:hypothetical protein